MAPATRVPMLQVDFSSGPDGTLLSAIYSTSLVGPGNVIRGGGYDGDIVAQNWDFFGQASIGQPEMDRRPTLSRHQYAQTEVVFQTALNPGVMVRGFVDVSKAYGYMVDPMNYAGTSRLGRWLASSYTQLATGMGTGSPAVGDTLSIEATRTNLTGWVNTTLEVSTTDATITTGNSGIWCTVSIGSAVGTNFEAGATSLRVHDLGINPLDRMRRAAIERRRAQQRKVIIIQIP